MKSAELLRLVTPALVSVSLFLLGLIYNGQTDMQKSLVDVRERVARLEARSP